MVKKLFSLLFVLNLLFVSCSSSESDPKVWIEILNDSKKDRKFALNKLEFIYQVDTTLDETCDDILAPKAWDKRKREIIRRTRNSQELREQMMKVGKAEFDKYETFCNTYAEGLKEKIPYFRKLVIPSLLSALETKEWQKDKIIKLLIEFQDPKEPIKAKDIQDLFIKTIKEFGGTEYLTNKDKIDARTVIAIRGLTELNKKNPHPETFKVLKSLLAKIYKRPEEYDSISQVRMALVKNIFKLRGVKENKNKEFNKEAADILVEIIRRGKHDTTEEKYHCQGRPCKQNFLINKKAAIKLGDLGVSNQKVIQTLVTCLYSVEVGAGRKRKSFRECKLALSKLYSTEKENGAIDPVGILSLVAEGDPARHPLAYQGKEKRKVVDKWYVYKDGDKYVQYGKDKHQSSKRSKSQKQCLENFKKYRNSEYFRFVAYRRYRHLLKTLGSDKVGSFSEYLEKIKTANKKRVDNYGDGACKIFVLNELGGWDKKDSAVVERTALEALRGMGAGDEIKRIFLENYSSYAMEAYWDFTADQSWEAAKVRCEKEGMMRMYIKKHCVPKYNNNIDGIKSQWNKLKDYNWLVDASKEAMYGAGWYTTSMVDKLSRRIRDELEKRLKWLHDPRSTVFAAKALAMIPYKKKTLQNILDVVVDLEHDPENKDAKTASLEPWHIATELLWEQYRQQTIQNLQMGNFEKRCAALGGELKDKCQKKFGKAFQEVMEVFQMWSFNKDRWLRSRYMWISALQDYFGYWPIDPKTKKPNRMDAKTLYKEYVKWTKKCEAKRKAFSKTSEAKKKPENEPICDGYDKSKDWGWNIRASEAAKGMSKAGISSKEAEKRLILTGYERVRLDILKSVFDYASIDDFKTLLSIKPKHIMIDPGPHPLDKVNRDKLSEAAKVDYELMVQRPWDDKMEKDRQKAAKKVIKEELNELFEPIHDLKSFSKAYLGSEAPINNISALRTIIQTVSIKKPCPEKDEDGKVPSCAVFEDKYNEETNEWIKVRKSSRQTIFTPWRARHKALMLINSWDKNINEGDRKNLVQTLATTYEKSEVPVREAILLVLDRWSKSSDYKDVAKPIKKVVKFETENHRRGGYFWMNQRALSFLGRLKGKK